jgi:hemolysin III
MSNKPNYKIHRYTVGEEIANSITHGIGLALSIAGLVILIVFAVSYGNIWHIVSFSIFGSTLIILYLASTLYHSIPKPSVKRIFRIIDHSAVFLLIAGTYTPFLLGSLRGAWGWSLFGIIWGLTIIGIVLKSVCISKYQKVSVAIYIFMGWLVLN